MIKVPKVQMDIYLKGNVVLEPHSKSTVSFMDIRSANHWYVWWHACKFVMDDVKPTLSGIKNVPTE